MTGFQLETWRIWLIFVLDARQPVFEKVELGCLCSTSTLGISCSPTRRSQSATIIWYRVYPSKSSFDSHWLNCRDYLALVTRLYWMNAREHQSDPASIFHEASPEFRFVFSERSWNWRPRNWRLAISQLFSSFTEIPKIFQGLRSSSR